MLIEVHIDGEELPRRLQVRRADDHFVVHCEDAAASSDTNTPMIIDCRRLEDGVLSLLIEGLSYEVRLDPPQQEEDRFNVHVLNRSISLRAADIRHRRIAPSTNAADGVAHIIAPIPGRVVQVLRECGSAVTRGEGIIVLEAMKMENELKAPRDGILATIEVEEGEGVKEGTLLATIE